MADDKPKKSRSRKLHAIPSPACRAKVVTKPDLVDCLTEPPFYCQHKLHFGHGNYCRHPQRLEIAARTEAAKRAKKP